MLFRSVEPGGLWGSLVRLQRCEPFGGWEPPRLRLRRSWAQEASPPPAPLWPSPPQPRTRQPLEAPARWPPRPPPRQASPAPSRPRSSPHPSFPPAAPEEHWAMVAAGPPRRPPAPCGVRPRGEGWLCAMAAQPWAPLVSWWRQEAPQACGAFASSSPPWICWQRKKGNPSRENSSDKILEEEKGRGLTL